MLSARRAPLRSLAATRYLASAKGGSTTSETMSSTVPAAVDLGCACVMRARRALTARYGAKDEEHRADDTLGDRLDALRAMWLAALDAEPPDKCHRGDRVDGSIKSEPEQ